MGATLMSSGLASAVNANGASTMQSALIGGDVKQAYEVASMQDMAKSTSQNAQTNDQLQALSAQRVALLQQLSMLNAQLNSSASAGLNALV